MEVTEVSISSSFIMCWEVRKFDREDEDEDVEKESKVFLDFPRV